MPLVPSSVEWVRGSQSDSFSGDLKRETGPANETRYKMSLLTRKSWFLSSIFTAGRQIAPIRSGYLLTFSMDQPDRLNTRALAYRKF